jgi:hypothetical protein
MACLATSEIKKGRTATRPSDVQQKDLEKEIREAGRKQGMKHQNKVKVRQL